MREKELHLIFNVFLDGKGGTLLLQLPSEKDSQMKRKQVRISPFMMHLVVAVDTCLLFSYFDSVLYFSVRVLSVYCTAYVDVISYFILGALFIKCMSAADGNHVLD